MCASRPRSPGLRLIVGALLLLGLLTTACVPPQAPLRLGSNPWPGYLPLYYARHLGELDPRQVRLVDFDTTEDVIRALRNGAIDLAAVTLDEALLLSAQGMELVVLLPFDVSAGADSLLARPPLQDLTELQGQRLGVELGALGAYVLARVLELGGLQAQDLDIVNLSFSNHAEAYRQGRVDALITFEPQRSQVLAAGAREIFSSRELPGEIVDVLVAPRALVEQRRATLRTLVQGHYAGLAALQRDPSQAAAVLAGRSGLQPEALLRAWTLIQMPNLAASRQLMQSMPRQLVRLRRILADAGLLSDPAPALPQVDAGLLPTRP